MHSAKPALLIDFDGTLFRLFAHVDLAPLAKAISAYLAGQGFVFDPDQDPFNAPKALGESTLDVAKKDVLLQAVDQMLRETEVDAIASGEAVPGAIELCTALAKSSLPWGVVSNNSPASIRAFFNRFKLQAPTLIIGREPEHPEHLKPSPYPLQKAAEALHLKPEALLLVGDEPRDDEAAKACGCSFWGLAATPIKQQRWRNYSSQVKLFSSLGEIKAAYLE
jgi:HAD superfamily hydrolase (TIGR01549 family)